MATGEALSRLPAARMGLIAFCCRAGNQSLAEMDDTPLDDLLLFSRALSDLCEREAAAMKPKG